jgi:hypothetical protein
MDIFEVGSKIWFVDEKNPGVWHLLVTEEIVKKTLDGVSRDYLFNIRLKSGKKKTMHSRDMEGKFFSERQKAFGFMVDHAKLSINSMMDKVEIKEQSTSSSPKPSPDIKLNTNEKTAMLNDIETKEAMVELPDGRMARVRVNG